MLSPDAGTKQQRSRSFRKSPSAVQTLGGGLPPSAPISPTAPTLSPASLSIARGVHCVPLMCRLAPSTALARGAARDPHHPGQCSVGGRHRCWPRCGSTPILWGNEQDRSNLVAGESTSERGGNHEETVTKDAEIRRAGMLEFPVRIPCWQSQPTNPHRPVGFAFQQD